LSSEMAPFPTSTECPSGRSAEHGKVSTPRARIGSGFRGAGLSMVSTPRASTGASWPSHSSALEQTTKGYAAPSAAARLPQPPTQPRESNVVRAPESARRVPAKVSAPPGSQSAKVFAPPVAQQSPELEACVEKKLGSLGLRSPESVDVAMRLVDLAVAKVGCSKFKELYEAKAVILSGKLGRAGDFGSDNMIQDFARVWQEQVFEEAVQCLCVAQGFARGTWNVAMSTDYPGQSAMTEARFALHWAGLDKGTSA